MRKFFLFTFLLLIAGAGIAVYLGYRNLSQPHAHQQADTYIDIPRGSSVEEIINTLHDRGVIGHKWPLLIYLRATNGAPKLKAGEYTFPSPISPLQVLAKLEEGQQRLSRLTIIEGWTRWEIAAAMSKMPEFKMTSAELLELMNDTAEIRDLDPEARNLEGYLYPDTYSFPPDSAAREVISQMVNRFRRLWTEKFRADAEAQGRTAREVMTVASLIESEAKLKEDRPQVSSVIYNRLAKGMNLGIDSTVIYAAKLAGKWRNDGKIYQSYLDLVSPYNTRKVVGLPPGPVVSPGAEAIDAALHPAQTDYLFYVREPARNDGAHNFYNNENDFQRGVQSLREWERQRDARQSRNEATPAPPS